MPVDSNRFVEPEIGVHRPRVPSTASRSLSATGTTTIVSVSEAGKLLEILLNTTATPTGTPSCQLQITIDGGTREDIVIYVAAATWVKFWELNSPDGNDVGANGSVARIFLDVRYDTSLLIELNTTGAGTGGTLAAHVLRATKQ